MYVCVCKCVSTDTYVCIHVCFHAMYVCVCMHNLVQRMQMHTNTHFNFVRRHGQEWTECDRHTGSNCESPISAVVASFEDDQNPRYVMTMSCMCL
jgi:hypothetical protein